MEDIKRDLTFKKLGSKLFLFLILLNYISFLNIKSFKIYQGIGLYVNLILVFIIFIFDNKINSREQGILFFASIFTIYGLGTLLITGGGFGSVITPVYSILIFLVFTRSNFNNRVFKIFLFTLLAVNLFWVVNSTGYYLKFLYNQNDYINSNTIGMLLMYTAICISIFIKRLKYKCANIITLIVFIASGWAILNCQARGSFISLIIFFIFDNIIPKSFWRNKSRMIFITYIIIVIGIMFPYVYTILYNKGINYVLPFTSKSLYTGRELIWNNFYESMGESIIYWTFGLGSNADLWAGHNLNVHNNYLGVIANFGIIGFFMYYGFIVKQISNVYKNKSISSYQISLVVGFIVTLINGFLEITTLWHVMFFFNFMFLGLALYRK